MQNKVDTYSAAIIMWYICRGTRHTHTYPHTHTLMQNNPEYDAKVDMYSAAIIMWYICRGTRPLRELDGLQVGICICTHMCMYAQTFEDH